MKNIFKFFNVFIFAIVINGIAINNSYSLNCSVPGEIASNNCPINSNSNYILHINELSATSSDYTNYTPSGGTECCRLNCINFSGSMLNFSATDDSNANCYCPGGYRASETTNCVACADGEYSPATSNNCSTCPPTYDHSDGGQDAETDCYHTCSQTDDCKITSGSTTIGCFETSGATKIYNPNPVTSGCCLTTVDSCIAGYYKNTSTCTVCPSEYPNSDAADNDSENRCYTNCTSTYSITSGTWNNTNSDNKAYATSGTCNYHLNCVNGYVPSADPDVYNESTTCTNRRACAENVSYTGAGTISGDQIYTGIYPSGSWDSSYCIVENISYEPANSSVDGVNSGTKNCNLNSVGNDILESTCDYDITYCNAGYYWDGTSANCSEVGQGYYRAAGDGVKSRKACPKGSTTDATGGSYIADAKTSCKMKGGTSTDSATQATYTKFCNGSSGACNTASTDTFYLPVEEIQYK